MLGPALVPGPVQPCCACAVWLLVLRIFRACVGLMSLWLWLWWGVCSRSAMLKSSARHWWSRLI